MTISGRGRGRVTRWPPTYRSKRQGHVFAGCVFAGCVSADGRKLVFTGNEVKGGIQNDQMHEMRS